MPQVPVTRGNSVALTPRVVGAVRPVEMSDGLGQGLQEAGRALGQAAEQEQKIRDIYDDAAVKKLDLDLTQKARELLWTGDDAFFNRKGFSAQEALPAVEEQLKQLREAALGQAKNDRQRLMLGQVFETRLGSDLARMARHSEDEFNTEFEAQTTARVASFQTDAVRMAAIDEGAFAEHMAGGLGEIDALGQKMSWSEDRQTAAEEKFVSETTAQALNGMLAANETDKAISFFEKHRDGMLPKDEQAIVEKLTPVIEFREDEEEVTTAMASAPVVEPGMPAEAGSNLSTQLSAIESNESGGKQFASSGKTLTSSAGALGVMQVMPGTGPEAARLAGLPWSLEKMKTDPAYNRALGAAYYKEQLRRFGDPAKAAAAYNAGPGAMRSAEVKARRDGNPDDWVKYLPAETRDYVSKFRRKTGDAAASSGGSGATTNFSGAYAALEAKAAQEKWAPEVLERRRKRLDQRVDREVQLNKLKENEEWDVSLEVVDSLGDNFTSISQIPNFDRLPPERRRWLREEAERNSAPKSVEANGDLATSLSVLSIESPEQFLQTDLREFKSRMTPGEYASLQKRAAAIRANPEKEADLLSSVRSHILTFAPADMKITGEKNKGRFSRFANGMVLYINSRLKPGEQPTLALREAAFQHMVNTFSTASEAGLATLDIPSTFVASYTAEYRRLNRGRNPTIQDLNSAWARKNGK
jgi:hypothetical protein